jgi:hypothetical protein
MEQMAPIITPSEMADGILRNNSMYRVRGIKRGFSACGSGILGIDGSNEGTRALYECDGIQANSGQGLDEGEKSNDEVLKLELRCRYVFKRWSRRLIEMITRMRAGRENRESRYVSYLHRLWVP